MVIGNEKEEALAAFDAAVSLASAERKLGDSFDCEIASSTERPFSLDGSLLSDDANEARKKKAKAEKLEQEAERLKSENKIRTLLGKAAIFLVTGQLVVCDIAMIAYGVATVANGATIPTQVVVGWMAATLVEVIGILWVIARSLYPMHDDGPRKK